MAEPLRNVRFELGDRTAWITVDRPDKLNALDRLTIDEIGRAVSRAVDDEGVGVIVLTGAGQKAFVAGADIAEMARMDARDGQLFSRHVITSYSIHYTKLYDEFQILTRRDELIQLSKRYANCCVGSCQHEGVAPRLGNR